MKKLLAVLAVVMLAAFAAPAFAATNPFMDVPASHWAYDAVAQLAARGVISGYPDGTFKGPQPATRYEIASIIARSLAYVDADKASKADVEMMRRLIVEFSDELSALGVTVDEFDGRLGQLESDLGGWKLSGVLDFRAKFGEDRLKSGDADFDLDKYRIFLTKRINETTSFYARLGKGGSLDPQGNATLVGGTSDQEAVIAWNYYYITTKLGYDVELTAGRFYWDWEGDYGLYTDNDAVMGDVTLQGFGLKKDWGIANLALLVERGSDDDTTNANSSSGFYPDQGYRVAANVNVNFNEKFSAGAMGYFDIADDGDNDKTTVGLYAKFQFHPSVALKGLYYFQDLDKNVSGASIEDNPNAWKAILDINQDLLKFTSLWLEYSQIDNTFANDNAPYKNFDAGPGSFKSGSNNYNQAGTTKFILVKATQQWNDKWDSWVRYNWADYDAIGVQDFSQYGVGIGYQLNPAVHFELGYDYAEYDDNTDDNQVRFSTVVNF